MSNYTKTTDFAAKDALISGDPDKTIVGTEIDDEFNAIATAVGTKADAASPTLTGTGTAVNMTFSGTLTASGTVNFTSATVSNGGTVTTVDINGGTVDGAVIGGSSPAAGSFTTLGCSGALSIGAEIVETVYALSGTTPSIDPANGTIQTWTLSGNSTPTSAIAAGESVLLQIFDGTAYTITWPTMDWVGGSAPTLDTTDETIVLLWKVGSTLYGSTVGVA